MRPLVFISYRRTDSQHAALGIYAQLCARIGTGSVFMDRSGIPPGGIWPERLRDAICRATVVLALIGPDWLKSADEYGRRRLDNPDDWVRKELSAALDSSKPVIPILMGDLPQLPPIQAFPEELKALGSYQAYSLRDDHWESDIDSLVKSLVEGYRFKEVDQKVRLPQPELRVEPLTQDQLDAALASLPGWEPVESLMPGDYPRSRHELRKAYVFKSFRAAINFMNAAIDPINQLQHHPRWENQWRTVTVHFSTWDIGFQISRLDIEMAKILDDIYDQLRPQPAIRGSA